MPDTSRDCPHCGAPVPEGALICPTCHTPLDVPAPQPAPTVPESVSPGIESAPPAGPPDPGPPSTDPPSVPTTADLPPPAPAVDPVPAREEPPIPLPSAPSRSPARRAATPPANPFAAELSRRLARVAQWAEGAQPLGVQIPQLPDWAEEAARTSWNPEPWAEAVRGIERIAQKRIIAGFEEWQKRTRARLTRLEAYAVDSRLERDQIDDTLHSARTGDIAQALATFQQVDRVVSLKEHHLDQAREELERVVALMRDMQALGVEPPQDPATVEEELESELRAGKLAPLKQQIRTLRLQAVNRLKAGLPRYISEYGDYLLDERAHGIATELEATELARGAREFFRGHPEEGLRRLRALQQTHGVPPGRAARSSARR
ncbi:MAG TPA: zinc ribbon domain-containing protein [Thermoplasmata archaeon]|nr:zinc ribbon domain-containing protein [Thermoplasmata archaeon]